MRQSHLPQPPLHSVPFWPRGRVYRRCLSQAQCNSSGTWPSPPDTLGVHTIAGSNRSSYSSLYNRHYYLLEGQRFEGNLIQVVRFAFLPTVRFDNRCESESAFDRKRALRPQRPLMCDDRYLSEVLCYDITQRTTEYVRVCYFPLSSGPHLV
jgi:hypothetical protein